MFFVQKGSDQCVQPHRFSLSGGSGNQDMRHFTEVEHKHFVHNGFTQHHGQVVFGLLKFARFHQAEHRYQFRIAVGHFYTDGAFARNGSNDANTKGCQIQCDIVFESLDLGDANSGFRYDFVQGDGGPHRGLNAGNPYAETFKYIDNFTLVFRLFLVVYHRSVIVLL